MWRLGLGLLSLGLLALRLLTLRLLSLPLIGSGLLENPLLFIQLLLFLLLRHSATSDVVLTPLEVRILHERVRVVGFINQPVRGQ